jgi:hypothetical protein
LTRYRIFEKIIGANSVEAIAFYRVFASRSIGTMEDDREDQNLPWRFLKLPKALLRDSISARRSLNDSASSVERHSGVFFQSAAGKV